MRKNFEELREGAKRLWRTEPGKGGRVLNLDTVTLEVLENHCLVIQIPLKNSLLPLSFSMEIHQSS